MWALLVPGLACAEPLRLAVSRTPLSLPLYVAEEKGYFSAESVEVQLQECLGGQRCLAQMLEGRADVATVADLPMALTAFRRTDFAIIASFVHASEDLKIIMRGPKGGDASLTSRRIGVPIGSAAQYYLDLFLIVSGIDPRTVRIVDLRPEQLVENLVSGKVDAIACWEPYGYQALKALNGGGHALSASNGYIQTFNLAVQRRLVGVQDVAFERLLRALRRAELFIQQEPDAAKAILRRRLAMESDFLEFSWPSFSYRLGLDQALIATMESQARWALREGQIAGKAPPNYLSLVHAAPLRKVKPTAATIGR
ncbi:ABC transporter substrate-binding protein [Piscinibacter sp. HJYY11]|uniref:ABC transporter substrate-binding protein n=1 Tax=Piscinibacter sp. HJYY11 TaxID=2801333 RepID=UPI00191D6DBC|nr:ABC transporter substrate-binding protein [Piscinibacter sp. HJYY11]MBL0728547.1 ABC transporter substrate-binding protein [Piscinibacter sp. HJYY11]